MKKITLLTLLQLAVIQAFCQLNYFNRTGEGFSAGVSYLSYHNIKSYSGEISGRLTKVFSANVEFIQYSTRNSYGYGSYYHSSATVIPSVTIQAPNDTLLGVAFNLGFSTSSSSNDLSTFLLALEIYHRFNAGGLIEFIPSVSVGKVIFLKDTASDPDINITAIASLALRLGKRVMLVGGPSVCFNDGQRIWSGYIGVVVQ